MRIRVVLTVLSCFLCMTSATQALAQNLPADCKEAQATRSPQAQVNLFTSCLDSGALSGNPKATAFKQRAVAYMHLGQHQRAIDDINQAMKIRSDDADNFYLRGFAYRALGQNQKAVDDSTQAIWLEPDFAAAFANRAFSQQALGNIDRAKADAQRALDLDPTVKVPAF